MKRKSSTELPSLLPVPESVVKHHGKTLVPIMQQWFETKRVPPVILVTGIPGVGKRSMVYFLSQWLLCQKFGLSVSNGEEDSTGDLFGGSPTVSQEVTFSPQACPPGEEACSSCQRAYSKNWIDFQEISADQSTESKSSSLKIEQVSSIKNSLGHSAFEGSFKIFLIKDAETLTRQAANTLLKLLEEPPAGWIFFLTAADSSLVLPTLVSRCHKLRLKPFSQGQLEEILREDEMPPARISGSAELAQGSWKRALELCQDTHWEYRERVLRFFKQPQLEFSGLIDAAASEPRSFTGLMDHLEQILWGLIQRNPGVLRHPVLSDYAQSTASKRGSEEQAKLFWIDLVEKIEETRKLSSAPLNRKLLLQDLLMPWLTE